MSHSVAETGDRVAGAGWKRECGVTGLQEDPGWHDAFPGSTDACVRVGEVVASQRV